MVRAAAFDRSLRSRDSCAVAGSIRLSSPTASSDRRSIGSCNVEQFRIFTAQEFIPQLTHEPRMIPLRAENPHRSVAAITVLLIAVNVVVFLYQLSLPPRASQGLVESFGLVPARTTQMLEPARSLQNK